MSSSLVYSGETQFVAVRCPVPGVFGPLPHSVWNVRLSVCPVAVHVCPVWMVQCNFLAGRVLGTDSSACATKDAGVKRALCRVTILYICPTRTLQAHRMSPRSTMQLTSCHVLDTGRSFFCARWRVVLRCTFRLLIGTEDTFRICILHILVTRFREYLLLVLDHGVFDRPGGDKLPVLVVASDWRSGARGARGMPFSCAPSIPSTRSVECMRHAALLMWSFFEW